MQYLCDQQTAKRRLTKTDGCVNVGTPDKNEFIVKCPAQTTVCAELIYIIQELKVLQGS
ncbi:MAG: hypothetical protein ACXV5N_13140 [Halobacteriota archaeon]